jgi:hypothetical protein
MSSPMLDFGDEGREGVEEGVRMREGVVMGVVDIVLLPGPEEGGSLVSDPGGGGEGGSLLSPWL